MAAYTSMSLHDQDLNSKDERPTSRQLTILSMCARGYSREEIGLELYISPWTVKRDLEDLRRLIGAKNVTHALALCITTGLLTAGPEGVMAVLTDEQVACFIGAPGVLEALSVAA